VLTITGCRAPAAAYNDPAHPLEPAIKPMSDFAKAHAGIATYAVLNSWLAAPTPVGPSCVDVPPDSKVRRGHAPVLLHAWA